MTTYPLSRYPALEVFCRWAQDNEMSFEISGEDGELLSIDAAYKGTNYLFEIEWDPKRKLVEVVAKANLLKVLDREDAPFERLNTFNGKISALSCYLTADENGKPLIACSTWTRTPDGSVSNEVVEDMVHNIIGGILSLQQTFGFVVDIDYVDSEEKPPRLC